MSSSKGFEKNVFVNCPFDGDYLALLRPLLFTIIDLGFNPRITLETLDSGHPRVEKILKLISESKFAIHDLSRLQAKRAGEYFRLNMPFELGIDIACRRFKKGKWSQKKCLILETKKYRFQAAISDIANSDIEIHGNKPAKVVTVVRNWLSDQAQLKAAPGPSKMLGRFWDFMADNHVQLISQGYSKADIAKLPINELMKCIREWRLQNP